MPDQSDKPKADDTQREAEEKSRSVEERIPEGGSRGASEVLLPGSPDALMPGAGLGLGGAAAAGRSEGEQVLAEEGKAVRSETQRG